MRDGAIVTSESKQTMPGRNCYHQRMRERDEAHRDLTTSQRVYIRLQKIAVETEDPALILENFEQRYIQEELADSETSWQ